MKKKMQYLPFILWSISTIILTIVAFIILPVLLAWEKIKGYIRTGKFSGLQIYQEYENQALPGYD
jgi:succinate dehydrogenase/fumarate reductase cytochrome b subunit